MSGVLLGMTDADVPTVPREALTDLAPAVVPTLRRDFQTSERLSAWVRVYQGGNRPLRPVRVSATLTAANGTTS